MSQGDLILKKYSNQNRFHELGSYLNFLKVGIEDGWLSSSNKELQAIYRMINVLHK